MRRIYVLATLCLLGQSAVFAQDGDAETILGEALVRALAENDVVAYSQCWTSSRRMLVRMNEIGVDLPTKELQKMREYNTLRNRSILESFRKIQSLIEMRKIDRKSIRLKSCKPQNVREKKAPKAVVKQAGSFEVVMSVGDEDWELEIDDGVVDNQMWYFADAPINLHAGDAVLSFRDHRKPP